MIAALVAAVVAGTGWFSLLVVLVDADAREGWSARTGRNQLITAALFASATGLGWIAIRLSGWVRRWLEAVDSPSRITVLSELIGRLVVVTSVLGLVLSLLLLVL